MLNNIAFCQAAIGLVLRGENTVLSPHAESGAQSIYEAAISVAEGRSPAALAAGVSEKFSAINLARETLAEALSASACRPFSSERDGSVLGEGCAVLSMESEASVSKRGAVPLARLSGYGEAFAWQSEAEPDAETISKAMGAALGNAGLRPSDIDVLIAHGDGTLKGDGNEIEAVNGVFSGCDVKVYSSKGALGHMLAGSPAVDVALAMRMITDGKVPPTLNVEPLDEGVKFDIVRGKALKTDVKRVMINCTSREGHCAALVVVASGDSFTSANPPERGPGREALR
jgi:3-oxoacyl-(acyl-carrier-protein) synthase